MESKTSDITEVEVSEMFSPFSVDHNLDCYRFITRLQLWVDPNEHELKEMYRERVKQHNQKIFESQGYTYIDAGFDLITPESKRFTCLDNINELEIRPTEKIDFKVRCAAYQRNPLNQTWSIPTGFYMYPRSSLSKTPLRLANSVGIIDSGYRGNLKGFFDNMYKTEDWVAEKHTRLVQICSPTLSPIIVEMVDTLDDTERGDGGFGSTGR